MNGLLIDKSNYDYSYYEELSDEFFEFNNKDNSNNSNK